MKKRLLLGFMAVFVLMQAYGLKPENVSATYLSNYTQPFTTTSSVLIDGQRFLEIDAPWVTENGVGVIGVDCTEWHLDPNKNYCMQLASSWDGNAADVSNMKVYQTVTLPAGEYKLTNSIPNDAGGKSSTYLVVDDAIGIPNFEDLATNALAYVNADDSLVVHFTLTEETQISIGAVVDDTFGEWNAVTLSTWNLFEYVEGIDMTYLNQAIAEASSLDSEFYPIGTEVGEYSQEKWDALQTAITDGETLVALGDGTNQAAVDSQTATIIVAMEELMNSQVPVFNYSDGSTVYWYQMESMHATKRYWNVGAKGDYTSQLLWTATGNSTDDAQLFKFVKDPESTTAFDIYSKSAPTYPLAYTGNDAAFEDGLTATKWKILPTNSAGYYMVARTDGNALATYGDFMGFWTDATDINCKIKFVFVKDEVITSVDSCQVSQGC